MNQKRAKKMRRAIRTVGYGERSRYDEVRFERTYTYRKLLPNGKTEQVTGTYPVRTLFLVKCERAVYRRLKRRPRDVQDSLVKELLEAHSLLRASLSGGDYASI